MSSHIEIRVGSTVYRKTFNVSDAVAADIVTRYGLSVGAVENPTPTQLGEAIVAHWASDMVNTAVESRTAELNDPLIVAHNAQLAANRQQAQAQYNL